MNLDEVTASRRLDARLRIDRLVGARYSQVWMGDTDETVDAPGSSPEVAAHDRRSDERAAIELKVEYLRLNSFFSDYAQNISHGGTFIKTSKPLDTGTEFLFKLFVPGFEEPLEIVGCVERVVAQQDATELEPAGMGIRFVYTDEDERRRIEETVEEMMIESLGQSLYNQLMSHSRDGGKALP